MFCGNCGAKLMEGDAFCSACGCAVEKNAKADESAVNAAQAPVVEAPAVEAPVVEAPVSIPAEEVPAAENTAFENFDYNETVPQQETLNVNQDATVYPEVSFAQPAFEQPVPVKNKKKRNIIALVIAGVAAIMAVLVAFNFTYIKGFFIKTFGSDADYYKFVEKKFLSEGTDFVSDVYGLILDASTGKMDENATANYAIELDVGNKGNQFANNLLGTDISWLDGAKLEMNSVVDDNLSQIQMALSSNGNNVLSFDYIMDLVENEIFVKFPEFSNKYFYMDMGDMNTGSGMSTAGILGMYGNEEAREKLEEIIAILPDEGEMNDLLERYIDLAIDSIDDEAVTYEEKEIKIDGETLKVDSYVLTVDNDVLQTAVIAMMEGLKEDKDLEKYFNNFVEYYEDQGANVGIEWDDFADRFDDLIDAVDDVQLMPKGYEFEIITYVNGSHEIIGRALEVSGNEIFSYVCVENGSEIFVDISVSESSASISGRGTKKGGKITGEFSVKIPVAGITAEVGTIKLENFEYEDSDSATGSIIIAPSSNIYKKLTSLLGVSIGIDEPSLKFTFDKDKIDIYLYDKDEIIIGVKINASIKDGGSVQKPDPDDAKDLEDIEDYIDEDALLEQLKKSDLGKVIVEMYEKENSYNNYYDNDYDYDYDYDYGYDYDDYDYDDYYSSYDDYSASAEDYYDYYYY